MTSDYDLIIIWSFVAIIVVGCFMAFTRALRWYRGIGKVDPLNIQEDESVRFSLRRLR
jgi:hypothetical protein